jgi:hypothetical protein
VPLFVEELTRAVIETAWSPREIPATLQDTLMARLDPGRREAVASPRCSGATSRDELVAVAEPTGR